MSYTEEEVIQFAEEEDVKFIRLSFCDIYGKQKNISIMPTELPRVFKEGIAFDASAIAGFGCDVHSDLFLHPDPDTLSILPWRPEHGRVVRMYCTVSYPDGRPFENDCRSLLKQAVKTAADEGIFFSIGSEVEFYLFRQDENGMPTNVPYDNAGYLDVAPDDKGENIRREICLTLERMGIQPECSHHEEGPGQNEIDFHYSDPLTAADNTITFKSVVGVVAARNGVTVDFSPKPIKDRSGNGMHINFSVKSRDGRDLMPQVIAGILAKASDMTLFFNPVSESYDRLGSLKAPRYISWSKENRSQLIRIPATIPGNRRGELRSPDPMTNPYLAYALVIYAGLYGIHNELELPEAADINLYTADAETLSNFERLPAYLSEAALKARTSAFIADCLPEQLIDAYCR